MGNNIAKAFKHIIIVVLENKWMPSPLIVVDWGLEHFNTWCFRKWMDEWMEHAIIEVEVGPILLEQSSKTRRASSEWSGGNELLPSNVAIILSAGKSCYTFEFFPTFSLRLHLSWLLHPSSGARECRSVGAATCTGWESECLLFWGQIEKSRLLRLAEFSSN